MLMPVVPEGRELESNPSVEDDWEGPMFPGKAGAHCNKENGG
jgi:hypothetical protein